VRRAQDGDGRRSRPGRGLSLDRIVAATLELVDEQGIGAASMRAVSSRLGVRSMSLYRYVRDRDELLDAVVERIVNELADDPEVQLRPVVGWRPYLSGMAHGVRRYALAHPYAFPLVVVPTISSASRDQAIFVDRATGACLSSHAVMPENDRLW
jgi:AcrR family transcriptional regulator